MRSPVEGPGGGSVSQRPVTLTLCGQRFHLAGFAFGHAQRGVTKISAYSQLGLEETDSGRISGVSWTIKTGLGLYGQCYTGSIVAAGESGAAGEGLPVEAPPRGIALAIPHSARLIRLTSYDAAGHPFASTTPVPPAK